MVDQVLFAAYVFAWLQWRYQLTAVVLDSFRFNNLFSVSRLHVQNKHQVPKNPLGQQGHDGSFCAANFVVGIIVFMLRLPTPLLRFREKKHRCFLNRSHHIAEQVHRYLIAISYLLLSYMSQTNISLFCKKKMCCWRRKRSRKKFYLLLCMKMRPKKS